MKDVSTFLISANSRRSRSRLGKLNWTWTSCETANPLASFLSSSVSIYQLQRTDRMLCPSGNDFYEAPYRNDQRNFTSWSSKETNYWNWHSSTILNTLDRYILQQSISPNVSKTPAQFIKAHDKKLKKLTKNVVLPFTAKETITNLSSHNLTPDQLQALKFGLTHSIYPPTISKTDIFACFELISHTMKRHLIDTSNTSKIVADLCHLAHC